MLMFLTGRQDPECWDLDDRLSRTSDSSGYRCVLSGARPATQDYPTPTAEMKALAQGIDGWQQKGIKPHEIAVVARTHAVADSALQAVRDAGLAAVKVEDSRVPTQPKACR